MKTDHKLSSPNQDRRKPSDTLITPKNRFLRSPKEKFRSPLMDTNKENQPCNSNQPRQWLSPVSPLQAHSPHHSTVNFQSPSRTTPHEALSYLRSNKGKQNIEEGKDSRLFSGISKDGKYRVESHSLKGQELAKACDYEKKTNLATILQSRRSQNEDIPSFEGAKTSKKDNGFIKSYAVNTHHGITRSYNEDRVSITLNIKKQGIRAHFFAIYDGHGGSLCCEFLKEQLHQRLISNSYFPADPKKALVQSITKVEQLFLQKAVENRNSPDKSGSCVLATLIVEDLCYVINVGDSRAIMSTDNGKMAFNLSRDHRPNDHREQERILTNGGKIYRTQMTRIGNQSDLKEKIVGPLRIFPGKLSVSRTIGDIQAKNPSLGGLEGVISSDPDIRKFKLTGKEDFIVMCCDGVVERLQSMEVVELVWKTMREGGGGDLHEKAGKAVDVLLGESMRRRSGDNLTVIVICLRELTEKLLGSPGRAN